MGNTSSSPKITSQDRAILQVKLQKDKLTKYHKKMNLLIQNENNQIKSYLRQNDKISAKTLLKRVKYQQNLIENVTDQIFNLENMLSNIEFKIIEREFLKGLQNGNTILTKLNKEMDVDKIEKLVDQVNDNIEYQQEIDNILSNSIIGKDIDDELDEELQALELEVSNKETTVENEDIVKNLPTVEGLPKLKDEEEKLQQKSKVNPKTALLA